ncbi:MAG: PstS family phosphate ABC transporter substrate-binding protein [Dehalococcoidia bacterium]
MAILLLGVLALAVAACGDDDDAGDDETDAPTTSAADETDEPSGDEFDYGSLSGEINIDGSSTVYLITAAMAEEFDGVASGVQVNVALSGTGGGFEKFCAGEIEISDASRPIRDNDDAAEPGEVQKCAANGIEDVVELQVGIDALTVMVNPENDFVECLTVQQLHDLFKTGGATNWNQVDPSFPDEEISFYYPGTDSGTFDYFVEEVVTGVDEAATHRGDGTSSEDDNILATGIEDDSHAIGYFGFAYYQDAGSALKAVQVDNGDGCVEPTFDNALSGDYAPLSRPLFIYTRESFLSDPESPVLGFVNFYLDNSAEIVASVNYISAPEDLLAQQKAKIEPFLP